MTCTLPQEVCTVANWLCFRFLEALTEEEKEKLAKIKKKMKKKVCSSVHVVGHVELLTSHPDSVAAVYYLGKNEEKGGYED